MKKAANYQAHRNSRVAIVKGQQNDPPARLYMILKCVDTITAMLKTTLLALAISTVAALAVETTAATSTMRLDYYHTGNASQEMFSVDRVVVEPLPWPGNQQKNIDDTNLGKYLFEVRDRAN